MQSFSIPRATKSHCIRRAKPGSPLDFLIYKPRLVAGEVFLFDKEGQIEYCVNDGLNIGG